MQKYEDNLAANTSGTLRPLSGAAVVVTDSATGLLAALYSNNGVTPLSQPLITDNDGYFGFYAADGKYKLTFTGARFNEFSREIVLEDPEDDPYATLAQLATPSGAMLVRHGQKEVGTVLDELAADVNALETGAEYQLPTATPTTLGGIKLGANLMADPNGVVSVGLTNGAVVSVLASAATAPRTHTFPDKTGTVALLSDIVSAGAIIPLGSATVSSGAIKIDFLNVFTPDYDRYVIEVAGLRQSVDGIPQLRVAVGGAALSTSIYSAMTSIGNATSGTATSAPLGVLNSWRSIVQQPGFTIDIYGANGPSVKGIYMRGLLRVASTSEVEVVAAASHAGIASTLSGFQILPSGSATFVAGSVRVYGIKN